MTTEAQPETIQPDATGDSTETQVVEAKPLSNRNAGILSQIVNRSTQERAQEMGEEQTPEEPGPTIEADADEPGQGEVDTGEELVDIVVDGIKKKTPLSKVKDAGVRALQKESAADKRLQEATAAKDQAFQMLMDARKYAQGQTTELPTPPEEGARATEEIDDKQLSQWVDAIQFGTDEEAKKAIREMTAYGSKKGNATSPETVKKAVLEAIRTEQVELVKMDVTRKIQAPVDKGGMADLFAKQTYHAAFVDAINRRLREGASGLDFATYQDAAKEVREELGIKLPGQGDGLDQRKEKKRTIDNPPSAGGKAPQPNKPDSPQSPADVIAEMRKNRERIKRGR